ncbi:MAG: Flp family type IVb pilin [Pseudooceanicola sp.]
MKRLAKFLRREEGAVTVDWVVLCALVVGLTVIVVTQMQTGTTGLTENTSTYMATRAPSTN